MTAAFAAIAGSAGAPSITFTADTSTGMYLISAGNLGLTSGGILGFTLNSAQVGVFSQSASGKIFMVLDTADATTSSNISTLATSGTGAISVGATTNWNTNGYLLVNNEIMSYTVASAAGLTINARGQLGTTSVTQATGSSLSMLYTGISKNSIPLPARATAGRPSSPVPGDYGYNTTLGTPEYFNGSIWVNTAPQLVPQGYLSPTAGVPIITGDATSQATIYYNPYNGNQLPIPNAGIFGLTTFSTAAIALSASQAVNNIYDIYAFTAATSGTLTFGISPSWSAGTSGSVTPGSCARGTGTGGTQLTQLNGLYVNTTTITLLNGASNYSAATASALYVGSVFISPTTAGTVNLHRSYGQTRQWGIWNAFNRNEIQLVAGESTASWTVSSSTYESIDGTLANQATVFCGLAEEPINAIFTQYCALGGASAHNFIAIGINSTSTSTGFEGQIAGSGTGVFATTIVANANSPPLLGINNFNMLEKVTANTGTYFGGRANCQMITGYSG